MISLHKIITVVEKELGSAISITETTMDKIVNNGGKIISNQHLIVGEKFMFIITYLK